MAFSYLLAHYIRFENLDYIFSRNNFFTTMAIVVASRAVVFAFSGIYKALWAYASIHDLIAIIKTTLLSSLVSTTALLFYNRFSQQSRMVPILDTIILLSLLCIRSFAWRIIRDEYLNIKSKSGKPTMILGAGRHGATLLNEIRRHHGLGLKPVVFLDDDPSKIDAHIMGIPVAGSFQLTEEMIKKFGIKMVIIAVSNPDGSFISNILAAARRNSAEVKILPSLGELFFHKPEISHIREIQVEDLLGRPVVNLEVNQILSCLKDKNILVTGAGGSIGGELCRQLAYFEPDNLILLDSAETPLYEIDYELRKTFPNVKIHPVIADVQNLSRLSIVFDKYKPKVVFHAAAYKHVPMMENNPAEAVMNNVMGTKNVADISRLTGVERFVLVSTDKAVNPVNIMGASKRAAELYIQHISGHSRTKFITVRFGNVLGSNGSVIPRFREQIQKGGPVTVTHPDIIRYFMTIPEAAQLVLQAGSMGQKGEIFLLKMGEPVRILDLAEQMIRLSGLQPYQDINIVFSGLRPGEKLFEELLLGGEGIKETGHPKIMVAGHHEIEDNHVFTGKLNRLFHAAKSGKKEEIFSLFRDIVPEYVVHSDYMDTEQKLKAINDVQTLL